MQVTKIVHQLLDATIHKTRIKSLLPVIQAIITSKQLGLTLRSKATYQYWLGSVDCNRRDLGYCHVFMMK